MIALYNKVATRCSRVTTHAYSTSFSLGIQCIHQRLRDPIYAIYGFVRFADEIVDTFHDYNKKELLQRFKDETYRAIDEKISLNPILHSFQQTVNKYDINHDLIEHFFISMEMDLCKKTYDSEEIKQYITGSAEAVGLMCLRVFCEGSGSYESLSGYAQSLGSAFQKVNFLRDMEEDFSVLGRSYFPNLRHGQWARCDRKAVKEDIERDFQHALVGIKQLPRTARLGVYVAYVYYRSLFRKIIKTPAGSLLNGRIRIGNSDKARLLAYSYLRHQLNLI